MALFSNPLLGRIQVKRNWWFTYNIGNKPFSLGRPVPWAGMRWGGGKLPAATRAVCENFASVARQSVSAVPGRGAGALIKRVNWIGDQLRSRAAPRIRV